MGKHKNVETQYPEMSAFFKNTKMSCFSLKDSNQPLYSPQQQKGAFFAVSLYHYFFKV